VSTITIVTDGEGVHVLNNGITVASVYRDDIISMLPGWYLDEVAEGSHDNCHNAYECTNERDDIAYEIQAAIDCASDTDGWVHHVDSGHTEPYRFCTDPACSITENVQDVIDNMRRN